MYTFEENSDEYNGIRESRFADKENDVLQGILSITGDSESDRVFVGGYPNQL